MDSTFPDPKKKHPPPRHSPPPCWTPPSNRHQRLLEEKAEAYGEYKDGMSLERMQESDSDSMHEDKGVVCIDEDTCCYKAAPLWVQMGTQFTKSVFGYFTPTEQTVKKRKKRKRY